MNKNLKQAEELKEYLEEEMGALCPKIVSVVPGVVPVILHVIVEDPVNVDTLRLIGEYYGDEDPGVGILDYNLLDISISSLK